MILFELDPLRYFLNIFLGGYLTYIIKGISSFENSIMYCI